MNKILKTSICPICEISTCNSYHGDCKVIKDLKQNLKTLLIAEIEKVRGTFDLNCEEHNIAGQYERKVIQAIEQLFSEVKQ